MQMRQSDFHAGCFWLKRRVTGGQLLDLAAVEGVVGAASLPSP